MSGCATISVEIELGWGFHDKADPRTVPELSDNGRAERDALGWFLSACDDAEVPVTFDVVGHLLLPSCDGDHDGPHPDGWFDRDPGTDADTDPLFYAPDIAGMIRDADVDHEICTHTFSHVLLDEVDDEVVDWELDSAKAVHDDEIVSLVPPRNRKPPYGVLRNHGIDVVRGTVDEGPPSGTVGRYVWTLTRDHPIDEPRLADGVVETRSSSFMTLSASYLSRGVSRPHPAYRIIPRRVRRGMHERFLRSGVVRAIHEDSYIHYWTHLYNLANEGQRLPVQGLLNAIRRAEDRGSLRVRRMMDLVEVMKE